MSKIHIRVAGPEALVTEEILLTAGRVGLPVVFTFDEAWDDLRKSVVFRAGGKTVCCQDVEEETVVPWEIMEKTGCSLQIGFYGINDDGTVAIPTVWAQAGVIQPAVDPEADPAMAPDMPMWQKNEAIALEAMAVADSVRQDADAGLFKGETPAKGIDYWTAEDRTQILEELGESAIGDISQALDAILAVQNSLIGGEEQ